MNATTTSSHLRDTRDTRDYPGLSMLNEVKDELDLTGWDERMAPEILAVRVDIHLAVRVELYMTTKNWDLAADISKYLVEKYPDQPQWWVHRANTLKEMGKVKEAKKVAIRGLKMHPNVTALHFNLACYDSLLGKFRLAKKRLKWVIKKNSRFLVISINDPDLAGLWDCGWDPLK